MLDTSVVRVGCSWVEYQWTQYRKTCWLMLVRGIGCGRVVLGHLLVRIAGGFLLAVLECGVWVLCGLYGLACCWVLRQQASFPGEWLPGFFLWGGSWWCSLG
jgi:hypothetical protein